MSPGELEAKGLSMLLPERRRTSNSDSPPTIAGKHMGFRILVLIF